MADRDRRPRRLKASSSASTSIDRDPSPRTVIQCDLIGLPPRFAALRTRAFDQDLPHDRAACRRNAPGFATTSAHLHDAGDRR